VNLDAQDRRFFFASILVPILVWWILTGRKKYSVKGMT
jgi:hypothetical protein